MNFELDESQRAVRSWVIAFARERLNADLVDRDRRGEFSRATWRELGRAGLLGLNTPTEFGGQGLDLLGTTIAMEALGYGCRDNGLNFAVASTLTGMQPNFAHTANDEQRAKYLPGLCAGDIIVCFGMTEPATGSDAFALKATAAKTGHGYVLNGEKWFITFGPVADVAIVFAATRPDLGKWGVSAFIVDAGTPGFIQTMAQEKTGLRTVPMGKLVFEDCHIPASNLLGREGAGASIFSRTQETERALILATQIGSMDRQIEDCVRHANERKAGGQPIGKYQAVSHRIADMKLRLECARLLTYKAAWALDQRAPAMLDSALANLQTSEAFLANSIDAVRTFGARGFVTDFEVERDFRDAMGGPIYSGTSDIQRNIVARMLGL